MAYVLYKVWKKQSTTRKNKHLKAAKKPNFILNNYIQTRPWVDLKSHAGITHGITWKGKDKNHSNLFQQAHNEEINDEYDGWYRNETFPEKHATFPFLFITFLFVIVPFEVIDLSVCHFGVAWLCTHKLIYNQSQENNHWHNKSVKQPNIK